MQQLPPGPLSSRHLRVTPQDMQKIQNPTSGPHGAFHARDTVVSNSLLPSPTTQTSQRASHIADDHPHPLKVIIVGAGIGGLTAAIGLRRNGHDVHIYEQSSFASEAGAAVHLAPNSNGLLRRLGIFAEDFGADGNDYLQERNAQGEILKALDLRGMRAHWQHPWLLCHRASLHQKLRSLATAEHGDGIPAKLHISSRIASLDPESGQVHLEDGTTVTGDVVLGADGLYSRSRAAIKDAKLFSSGKAAFRFLIPRQAGLSDPVTRPLLQLSNTLVMWFGQDRRVVMYPCSHNTLLNFVCIHPESESQANACDGWNKRADLDQLLKVYKDFDPVLLAYIKKVDPDGIKVWRLDDMETLPTWTRGSLALLGDAAHPFTPHQGQGASQAIEDAISISVVLPRGTSPKNVPERLKLYERFRYNRAHQIQDFSRLAGKDWVDGKPVIDMMAYTAYNFGHDEFDNSSNLFKRWKWSQVTDMYWRMPVGFGPCPVPRQNGHGRSQQNRLQRTFTTVSIKFKTSRTFLQTLFPSPSFRFKSPDTICLASISVTQLDNTAWLTGNRYCHLGLYIHGVEYVKRDGSTIPGTHLPVLFESLADPIVSGREELGMPKLFCDIDVHRRGSGSVHAAASWCGAKFIELHVTGLREEGAASSETGGIGDEADHGILLYRYIPAVGQPGVSDSEYAVVVPHDREQSNATVTRVLRAQGQGQGGTAGARLEIDGLDWELLPTLHHVAGALGQVPIYEIVDAKVVEGTGVPDVSSARRIE